VLVLAILAACFAYLGQLKVATSEPDIAGRDEVAEAAYRRNAVKWSDRLLTVAVVLALLSLGGFAIGTWFSALALSPARAADAARPHVLPAAPLPGRQ
jgi:hypothetical protein